MAKAILGLIVILGMACGTPTRASPVARVTAVASPAWIQRGAVNTEIVRDRGIDIGDLLVTGDNGLLKIQLWSGFELRVFPASAIRIMTPTAVDPGNPGNAPVLFIQRGRICLESPRASNAGYHFELKLAGLLLASIRQYAHICASRRDGMSSIDLRSGSVQIAPAIDSDRVILSQPGTEFRMQDDGSFQLLPAPSGRVDMNTEPFIIEAAVAAKPSDATADSTSPDLAAADDRGAGPGQTRGGKDTGGYIYTVYLFSTRSEEVARQVNARFQQAGHKTRILVNEKSSPPRYRIAVTGFEARRSAMEFADSIRGKLGVADTWIGKDRPATSE